MFLGLFITNQPTTIQQSMWAPRRLANAAVGLREQREKVEEAMLVGGLDHFLFFHILGRIIPTD